MKKEFPSTWVCFPTRPLDLHDLRKQISMHSILISNLLISLDLMTHLFCWGRLSTDGIICCSYQTILRWKDALSFNYASTLVLVPPEKMKYRHQIQQKDIHFQGWKNSFQEDNHAQLISIKWLDLCLGFFTKCGPK